MNDLHGILFAYHSDSNLGELTRPRNTCSLPFGGRYRLIDFMLSSYVNAGISDVGLIVHESYQSLLDHVGSGKDWDLSRKHGGLRILPPFGVAERGGSGEYRGNMEALAGIYTYLQNIRQEYVIMGWGDMVVNLPDGLVSDLSINPAHAANALESLETYIISKKLLLDMVDYCAAHNIHNFSRGVLLPRLSTLKVLPYLHRGYVARFQSVADYFQHSMDLLDPAVRADLFDPDRPIRTKDQSNPSTYYGPGSVCKHSLVADGCFIEGEVENSILSRGVIVEAGAKVSNSVLMQGTIIRAGASLSYTITDKNVQVNQDRMLMGHSTYPLAISKDSIV